MVRGVPELQLGGVRIWLYDFVPVAQRVDAGKGDRKHHGGGYQCEPSFLHFLLLHSFVRPLKQMHGTAPPRAYGSSTSP